MKGVTGMKTGFTNKAGYCFVGVVKAKSGKQYISVTLGAAEARRHGGRMRHAARLCL